MDTQPKKARFLKLSGSVAGLIVVLVILLAVNAIVSQFRLRKDFTEQKLYTLSDGSRKIVGKLDRDVTLMFFFNSSSAEVPAPLKAFAQQVEDLLKEYEVAGNGHVIVEHYDPKPDSDAEDLAQRYGLEGQALPQSGTMLYLGMVAVSGDRQAALPVVDPRNDELLEYTITRMIHQVTSVSKPTVGVLSSLPVRGSAPMPYMMPGQRPPQQAAWIAFRDLGQDYTVRTVEPAATRIDDDIDLLVVVHPKDLSDATLYALDQFVLRGGRLLAFVDPFCVADSGPGGGMSPFGMPSRSSTLGKLFDAWGVTYDPGKVIADVGSMTPLRGRNNTVENSPLYLSLRKANFAENDVLTSSLNSLMAVMAGAFGNEAADGLKLTPLIVSSEQSTLTEAMMAQFNPNGFRRDFKSGHKTYNLAVRLQGKFKTAFPNGKPREGEADTNQAASADAPASLAESSADGNVVLVADVDLLYDEFCGQELNFFGNKVFQPYNDNLNLFANMVEQMGGSADLISVRCRGTIRRPFTRVLALQADAQQQWMEQEQSLEEKLQATQQRMAELQQKKDDKQRFVMSREQEKELAGFREEVLKYKQDLKQVRRNLREGIEALGMKIKLINILLVPALVAIAGLVFFALRRSRAQRR